MTEHGEDERRPPFDGAPHDEAVEKALSSIARPVAREGFKQGLRESFLSSSGSVGSGALQAQASREISETGSGTGPASSPSIRPGLKLWFGLAAAALLVALALWFKPHGPRWTVHGQPGAGFVQIDATRVRNAEREHVEDLLSGATDIETEESGLRLQMSDLYLVDIAAHTHVILGPIDRHGRSEPLALQCEKGAIRIFTGPGLHAARMRVVTADLDVGVTGTSFAVDALVSGTCVCCLHGKVVVSCDQWPSRQKDLEEGRMCFVNRDRSPTLLDKFLEDHVAPLRDMETLGNSIWK